MTATKKTMAVAAILAAAVWPPAQQLGQSGLSKPECDACPSISSQEAGDYEVWATDGINAEEDRVSGLNLDGYMMFGILHMTYIVTK